MDKVAAVQIPYQLPSTLPEIIPDEVKLESDVMLLIGFCLQ